MNIEQIEDRISKDFPELTFIGKGYTLQMLLNDLQELRVCSLNGKAPECDSGRCRFESDLSLQLRE